MALLTRTYTFTDGTTAYGSQVESEIANVVTKLNSLNAATATWDLVKVVNSSSTPLIVDNSSGSNSIAVFRANGSDKVTVGSAGLLTTAAGVTVSGAALTMSSQNIVMGSNSITGLANGSATTDAMAYGQLPAITFQTPTIYSTQATSTDAVNYTDSGLSISITSKLSTSKVLLDVVIPVAVKAGAAAIGSIDLIITDNANATIQEYLSAFATNDLANGQQVWSQIVIKAWDTPGAAGGKTYKVRFKKNTNMTNGTVYVFPSAFGQSVGVMTATEYR